MKQIILDTVTDMVTDFTYYDRKEDEELPRGAIEAAVQQGEISVDEIVAHFRAELVKALGS